jgi:hypothetical protein
MVRWASCVLNLTSDALVLAAQEVQRPLQDEAGRHLVDDLGALGT